MTTHLCNFNKAWPVGHPLPPVNPDLLQGPEVGTFVSYRYKNEEPKVVKVLEQSYVWSPGECRHGGGYRRYDWSVIEEGPNGYCRIVVNDTDLTPLSDSQKVVVKYAIRED